MLGCFWDDEKKLSFKSDDDIDNRGNEEKNSHIKRKSHKSMKSLHHHHHHHQPTQKGLHCEKCQRRQPSNVCKRPENGQKGIPERKHETANFFRFLIAILHDFALTMVCTLRGNCERIV
jgi:methionyl-tRNA synthetase